MSCWFTASTDRRLSPQITQITQIQLINLRNLCNLRIALHPLNIMRSLIFCLLVLVPSPVHGQQPNRTKLTAEVKTEFLHAWNGYKKYAWGHDDLNPLSKTPHDWYAQPLLMTPVDALDTMIIMDLNDEAAETQRYILDNLSFDKDMEVQNFEITVRLLGALLTNY